MPRLSIWGNGQKKNDYKFIDNIIREQFYIGGTSCFVHKYLGPTEVNGEVVQGQPRYEEDGVTPVLNADGTQAMDYDGGETMIQDVLFLENRDRRYAPDVIDLRGVYTLSDTEFDLRQFGLFLENDTINIMFHLNDMVSLIGRKLMNGDVIELPHQRDEYVLGEDKPAINKFYVVEEGSRPAEGYSQTWFPHLWRVKCKPMTASQEYQDILDQNALDPFGLETDKKLQNVMSNVGLELGINAAILEEAKVHVSARNFDTRQFYVVPGDELGTQAPWIFAGDGVPPNNAALVGSGNSFPLTAKEGDFFLRTDYDPHSLFKRIGSKWTRIEIDYRQEDWSMAHRLLKSFINNRDKTMIPANQLEPARTFDEKQPLSQAIKPRADF
jgi:hypothetical protein